MKRSLSRFTRAEVVASKIKVHLAATLSILSTCPGHGKGGEIRYSVYVF